MPTVRIPIDLSWTGTSGSPGVNVFHGRIITGGIGSDLNDLTSALEDFYTTISDMFCTDMQFRFAGEAAGVGDDVGSVFTAPTWIVSGSNGVDHLSPALNFLVQWRTEEGGRNGRGRTYLGPLIDGASESNGTPGEAERAEIADAANALVDASEGFGDGALGVYSRTEDVFRDFTSATVPNYFAILRSRRD